MLERRPNVGSSLEREEAVLVVSECRPQANSRRASRVRAVLRQMCPTSLARETTDS
jgi:hypothetical protein